jgi:glycosyltransferase involved in cell wall biosynthesis
LESAKKRVAFVTCEYPRDGCGGAGLYARRLVSGLREIGQPVEVYCPESARLGLTGPIGSAHRSNAVSAAGALAVWARSQIRVAVDGRRPGDVQLVHTNGPHVPLFRLAGRQLRRIVTLHHLSPAEAHPNGELKSSPSLADRVGRLLEQLTLAKADAVVAVSHATAAELLHTGWVDPRRVHVVYHGVDANPFLRADSYTVGRWRADTPAVGGVVLFVGQLSPRKGLDDLFHAFAEALRLERCSLFVVGPGQRAKYARLAYHLGIGEQVRFFGRVDRRSLLQLYALADLVCVPSLWEGFSLVALEAMAAGKPIVASAIPPLQEVISREGAIFVPPRSPIELGEAISTILDDPTRAHEMGRANWQRAQLFSWRATAIKTVAVYEAVR